jgi:uncharacterized protein YbbC (DUF1343 family)
MFSRMTATILFGADRALDAIGALRSFRHVGLLTNDAATSATDQQLPTRVALQRAGVQLARLFTPEHGIRRTAPDGAPVPHGVDDVTQVPIYSIYGTRLAPPDELVADLDLLLIDLPDVGARFYTYAWSMTHAVDACARTGTPVAVFDRPNPLGGLATWCEGPELDEACCASFLGRLRMPIRHGITLGELALLWHAERAPRANLRVLPCEGWRRAMLWPDTGLSFVQPSPAMPSFDSALLYPGLCLFEATNVSVGRGSERPFRTIAADWLDPAAVRDQALVVARNSGVHLRAGRDRSALGNDVPSLHIDVDDPRAVRPVGLALALLVAIKQRHPREFRWTDYPTVANPAGTGHFERLIGRTGVRQTIDALAVADFDITRWCSPGNWSARVRPHLLYD